MDRGRVRGSTGVRRADRSGDSPGGWESRRFLLAGAALLLIGVVTSGISVHAGSSAGHVVLISGIVLMLYHFARRAV